VSYAEKLSLLRSAQTALWCMGAEPLIQSEPSISSAMSRLRKNPGANVNYEIGLATRVLREWQA
jgi:hypothetical protein